VCKPISRKKVEKKVPRQCGACFDITKRCLKKMTHSKKAKSESCFCVNFGQYICAMKKRKFASYEGKGWKLKLSYNTYIYCVPKFRDVFGALFLDLICAIFSGAQFSNDFGAISKRRYWRHFFMVLAPFLKYFPLCAISPPLSAVI